jgi:hypothetical protein
VVTLLIAKKNWLKFDFIGEFKMKDSKSALFVQVLLSLQILEEKEKLFLDEI